MNDMYNKIANAKSWEYDKANDKAYQQYAKMYQQLGGLSMAATQQAANELTAGYGSTYSPQVAMQTDNAYQANADSVLPSYYQMAQNEYDALRQKDLTNYEAAIEGYQNAENSNLNRKNAWADIVNSAAGRSNQENANAVNNYADNKDFWYKQYWNEQNAMNDQAEAKNERYWNNNKLKEEKKENKRDEYWAMNDVNVSIAADKADSYRDKKDNKGMKAYLQNQVKKAILLSTKQTVFISSINILPRRAAVEVQAVGGQVAAVREVPIHILLLLMIPNLMIILPQFQKIWMKRRRKSRKR